MYISFDSENISKRPKSGTNSFSHFARNVCITHFFHIYYPPTLLNVFKIDFRYLVNLPR